MMHNSSRTISVFALAMLITSAIDSIRNLPSTALFGSAIIFFSVLAAIIFLIPVGLVSAELSAKTNKGGGIFFWVEEAFGPNWGFLGIWLLWINTIVWYPTILSFIAGTAAYLIDPTLANNKYFLMVLVILSFWIMTFVNLFGLNISARIATFCAIMGMIIPVALIIICGIVWVILKEPSQLHLSISNIFPSMKTFDGISSLTAIITSYLGLELSTVYVKNIQNAAYAFPRALLIAVMIIITTMVFGALAIAIVLPSNQINLVAGVLEALNAFLTAFHLHGFLYLLAILIVIGTLGEMVNWIISPAKGLQQAAAAGFMPKTFGKTNQFGAAQSVMILQAVLVSIICAAFLLMPTVSASYWLLSDLSTELYLIMYFLMFLAAIRLKIKLPENKSGFQIPGGKFGFNFICGLGFLGCILSFIVGFIPPTGIDFGGVAHYQHVFALGIIIFILPVSFFYWYRHL